jgi:hypothetical protein
MLFASRRQTDLGRHDGSQMIPVGIGASWQHQSLIRSAASRHAERAELQEAATVRTAKGPFSLADLHTNVDRAV